MWEWECFSHGMSTNISSVQELTNQFEQTSGHFSLQQCLCCYPCNHFDHIGINIMIPTASQQWIIESNYRSILEWIDFLFIRLLLLTIKRLFFLLITDFLIMLHYCASPCLLFLSRSISLIIHFITPPTHNTEMKLSSVSFRPPHPSTPLAAPLSP